MVVYYFFDDIEFYFGFFFYRFGGEKRFENLGLVFFGDVVVVVFDVYIDIFMVRVSVDN